MQPPAESALAVPSSTDLAAQVPGELIAFPTGRYAIPAEDAREFDGLKLAERQRISVLLECFRQMESGKIRAEAAALAFKLRHVRGFSEGALVSGYYAWRANGWRSLIHKYKVNRTPLPADFVQFWCALCERYSRSIVQAREDLVRRWFAGESIPGYGTWVEWWHAENPTEDVPRICPGTPDGWSKSTLYEAGPSKAERIFKTRGFAAAKKHLPSMIRDTSALLPLQLITIDDFEVDQLAFFHDPAKGVRQLCKVTGIAALDVATRRVIGLVMKPRLADDDGKREAITRAEVRLLLFNVLMSHGIPTCGMTILCENAAAAITSELELTFRNLFGGKIAITRTGLIADKVLTNGFIERGGKPQQKGWIEARFNLLHNVASALPGQKGANYLVKPGDLEAKVSYTERLIGTGRDDANLTDEQLARVRLPFERADKLIAAYMDVVFPYIESRNEHKMIGFEELRRWRRNVQDTWHEWSELSALTQEEQLAVEWFPRELRESPRQRWDRLIRQTEIVKCDERHLMLLLLTPRRAEVRNHKVSFIHAGRGYAFANRGSRVLAEREGTEVLCYFDPARPHTVHCCHLDGRYIDEIRAVAPVDISNPGAMAEAETQMSELYNSILARVRSRPLHQQEDARLAADRAHNAAIVAEQENARPAKKPNLTRLLARDPFSAHEPAGTAAAESLAKRALKRSVIDQTAETIAASDELDGSKLL